MPKEDSKCHWLCTAMKKSTCSLDKEKNFKPWEVIKKLKGKKNVTDMKIFKMNMTWRTTLLQHTQWNFIHIMTSLCGLYIEFQKWNWVVLGEYGKLEEIFSTFMNNPWSNTTWIMEKIELEPVDVGLPWQLDMCVVI